MDPEGQEVALMKGYPENIDKSLLSKIRSLYDPTKEEIEAIIRKIKKAPNFVHQDRYFLKPFDPRWLVPEMLLGCYYLAYWHDAIIGASMIKRTFASVFYAATEPIIWLYWAKGQCD